LSLFGGVCKSLGHNAVRADGGTLNFNSNGLNVNDINDDNSNSNVAVSARALPELLSPFFFCIKASLAPDDKLLRRGPSNTFEPSAEHSTDIIQILLEGNVGLLVNNLGVTAEANQNSKQVNGF